MEKSGGEGNPRSLAGLVEVASEGKRRNRWRGENKGFSFTPVRFSVSGRHSENLTCLWVYGSGPQTEVWVISTQMVMGDNVCMECSRLLGSRTPKPLLVLLKMETTAPCVSPFHHSLVIHKASFVPYLGPEEHLCLSSYVEPFVSSQRHHSFESITLLIELTLSPSFFPFISDLEKSIQILWHYPHTSINGESERGKWGPLVSVKIAELCFKGIYLGYMIFNLNCILPTRLLINSSFSLPWHGQDLFRFPCSQRSNCFSKVHLVSKTWHLWASGANTKSTYIFQQSVDCC